MNNIKDKKAISSQISLDVFRDLDFNNYEGYVWYSDKHKPDVINPNKNNLIAGLKNLQESCIPFIVEGYLYSESEKSSISIKNFNGVHRIVKFDCNQPPNDDNFKFVDIEDIQYHPANNKIEGIDYLTFHPLKKLIPDSDDFKSWQTVANVFTGFEQITEKSN